MLDLMVGRISVQRVGRASAHESPLKIAIDVATWLDEEEKSGKLQMYMNASRRSGETVSLHGGYKVLTSPPTENEKKE